jgi:hypothetical protein
MHRRQQRVEHTHAVELVEGFIPELLDHDLVVC